MNQDIFQNSTLAQRVTEKLREDILSRRFEVGERITIKDISEAYGVSNMPVREAFRVLEGESLLEVNAYKGANVKKLDRNFICDVYGVLRALEDAIYETAMPNLTAGDLKRLTEDNALMRKAFEKTEDRIAFNKMNSAWHKEIIAKGTNKIAEEKYNYYHGLITSIRTAAYNPSRQRILDALDEHDGLIEALRSGDVAQLKLAVDRHSKGAQADFMAEFSE